MGVTESDTIEWLSLSFFFFWLKDNCLTMLCRFLPYININQMWAYLRSLPPNPHPISPTRWSQSIRLSSLPSSSEVQLPFCFTYGNVYVSVLVSQSVLPSPSRTVHNSVLYVCIWIFAMQIGSSVPFFRHPIYALICYLFLSFWLTSLCITDSRFIQLTRTNSHLFLFMSE